MLFSVTQETAGLSTKSERKEVGSLRRTGKARNGCVGEQESPRLETRTSAVVGHPQGGGPRTVSFGSENKTTETKLVRITKGR